MKTILTITAILFVCMSGSFFATAGSDLLDCYQGGKKQFGDGIKTIAELAEICGAANTHIEKACGGGVVLCAVNCINPSSPFRCAEPNVDGQPIW